jgi:hypothetical protein
MSETVRFLLRMCGSSFAWHAAQLNNTDEPAAISVMLTFICRRNGPSFHDLTKALFASSKKPSIHPKQVWSLQ